MFAPLVAVALDDSHKLVRVVVLKPLARMGRLTAWLSLASSRSLLSVLRFIMDRSADSQIHCQGSLKYFAAFLHMVS